MTGSLPRSVEPTAGPSSVNRSHERTDGRTDGDGGYERANLMSGNAHASDNGFVYLVHWPEAQFTKIGFSVDGRRWRPFLKRGGELLGVIRPTHRHASIIEWEMHVALCTAGMPRRFGTSAEAAPYLGGIGRGFTECYVDRTGRDVLAKLIEIDRVAARRRGA